MNNQQGSVTITAVAVMIFLGILASAIGLSVMTDLKISKSDNDAVQAQFAAEAGAKRALNAFYKHADDWAWLNQTWPIAKKTDSVFYCVDIRDNSNAQPLATTKKPAPGKYTVTSIGTANGISKIVKVNIMVPSSGVGGGKLTDGQGGSAEPFTKAIFAGGAISIDQHYNISGDIAANGAMVLYGNGILSGSYKQFANISPLPSFFSGGKFDGNLYKKGAKFPSSAGTGYQLDQSLYYINGGLTINENTLLDVSSANKTTIIYVTGNLIINQNVGIAPDANILFLVCGNTIIGQNFNKHLKGKYGKSVFVSGGAVQVAQNSDIDGSVVAYGSTAVWQNATINFSKNAIDSFELPKGNGETGEPIVESWE